jgi:hypothetical protein
MPVFPSIHYNQMSFWYYLCTHPMTYFGVTNCLKDIPRSDRILTNMAVFTCLRKSHPLHSCLSTVFLTVLTHCSVYLIPCYMLYASKCFPYKLFRSCLKYPFKSFKMNGFNCTSKVANYIFTWQQYGKICLYYS